MGVDRQWHYYGGPSNSVTESGWNGNIYVGDPGNWSHPTFGQSDARYTTRNRTSGWSVMDIISTDNEKLNILIGLNGKSIKRDSYKACLLYTSDAADDLLCVDLGGRRII